MVYIKFYAQWLVFTEVSIGHNHKVFTVLLYALQSENKPSSYGDSSFNRNLLLSVYICLLQNPTHNFEFKTQDLQHCQVIPLNATLFYIWDALAEKVSVWEQKTLKQTCQVMIQISPSISLTNNLAPQQYRCCVFRSFVTVYLLLGSCTVTMNVHIKWAGMWGKW